MSIYIYPLKTYLSIEAHPEGSDLGTGTVTPLHGVIAQLHGWGPKGRCPCKMNVRDTELFDFYMSKFRAGLKTGSPM